MTQTQFDDVESLRRADAGHRTSLTGLNAVTSVALVIATLALAAAAVVAVGPPIVALVGVTLMLPAAVVDVHERRLPDRFVGLAAAAVAVAATLGVLGGSSWTPTDLVAGGLLLAGPLLLVHLVSPSSMGFGDVKAAVVLGAAVGSVDPVGSLVALTIASSGGAVAGVVGRQRTVAFGPPLVVGRAAALLLTRSVIA